MTGPIEKLHAHLRQHRHSITPTRDAVYLALAKHGPCTKSELATQLARQADTATVYRALTLFLQLQIAHVVRYRLVELSDGFKQHHHHVVCTRCGRESGFNDDKLEQIIQEIAASQHLKLASHQIELAGLCYRCQLADKAGLSPGR